MTDNVEHAEIEAQAAEAVVENPTPDAMETHVNAIDVTENAHVPIKGHEFIANVLEQAGMLENKLEEELRAVTRAISGYFKRHYEHLYDGK